LQWLVVEGGVLTLMAAKEAPPMAAGEQLCPTSTTGGPTCMVDREAVPLL